ncbi:MAG TPA: cbb3-type cytochrome oxidase assembly protein CcoS [Myxococcota bacterium]|nr:cbb3-type cytochrome oxidase assembly protein CcoS [Myxococcota bacterium]
MSFLWITIPVTLLVAAALLAWVLVEVWTGGLDDWEGPALRAARDDDSTPERGADVRSDSAAGFESRGS